MTTASPPIVLTKDLDRASDFLAALLPSSEFFRESLYAREWIFRGHADASWRLVPTALRTKAEGLQWDNECSSNREQIQKEIEVVNRFFEVADQHAHNLPENSQFLRARLNALASPPKPGKTGEREQALRNWVETEVLSLVAVAQHHGIPTQLLDWTWSPFCATYFAAVTAAKNFKDGKDGRLCVWALSLAPFKEGRSVSPGDPPNEGYRVFEIVTVPTASNAPLHAQEGLFTYVHHLDDLIELDEPVIRDALDVLLEQKWFESLGRTLLYRFTLPLCRSSELLRLVAQLGASAGKYDPTLWGVKKELEERHLWDRPAL